MYSGAPSISLVDVSVKPGAQLASRARPGRAASRRSVVSPREEQVRGLDVAMHDAGRVRTREPGACLRDDAEREVLGSGRERLICPGDPPCNSSTRYGFGLDRRYEHRRCDGSDRPSPASRWNLTLAPFTSSPMILTRRRFAPTLRFVDDPHARAELLMIRTCRR
jgi:hypothetical protein